MRHQCLPGGVWAVGGLVWADHGLPTRSPSAAKSTDCPHGIRSLNPHDACDPVTAAQKTSGFCTLTALCSDKAKIVLFGLAGAFQPLRDSDIGCEIGWRPQNRGRLNPAHRPSLATRYRRARRTKNSVPGSADGCTTPFCSDALRAGRQSVAPAASGHLSSRGRGRTSLPVVYRPLSSA